MYIIRCINEYTCNDNHFSYLSNTTNYKYLIRGNIKKSGIIIIYNTCTRLLFSGVDTKNILMFFFGGGGVETPYTTPVRLGSPKSGIWLI